MNDTGIPRTVAFAAHSHIQAMQVSCDATAGGGLASHEPNILGVFPQLATQIDGVLKGARLAEFPVEQLKSFEPLIEVKTAKALGIRLPRSLIVRADEVIE